MDSMGIDVQVIFPQYLGMGLHPDAEVATALTYAYNRWFTSTILAQAARASRRSSRCPSIDTEGVPGHRARIRRQARRHRVHGDQPAAHAGCPQEQRTCRCTTSPRGPRHADRVPRRPAAATTLWTLDDEPLPVGARDVVCLSTPDLTNWIINGLPERFPNLKVIWVESGLAWIPFMMQRLDHEYLMRQSEAPLLSSRRPSEYMTSRCTTPSQPMEADNLETAGR